MNDLRFLIINPFGIGDVIFSTPLISILKTHFKDTFIGYVCNRRAFEVLKTNPYLDRIFVYEKDDYRDLWRRSRMGCVKKVLGFLNSVRRERFDISIDLSLGYQYSMFLKFIGIKKRIGFNYRDRGRFLTNKIDIDGFDGRHVIEYYLSLLALLNDVDVKRYEIKQRLYVADADSAWADKFLKDNGIAAEDLFVGIIPGCGASWGADAKYRRWDRKNFALLADRLIEEFGAKVVLLGNRKEIDISGDIEGLMKNKVINYCGRTSIGEFMGLMSRCRIIVTNDGGPLHMAAGLGVKTVSIFGPVDERVYGPYPSNSDHIVVSKKDVECRPCYRKFKYDRCEDRICLDSIAVEEVAGACERLLKR